MIHFGECLVGRVLTLCFAIVVRKRCTRQQPGGLYISWLPSLISSITTTRTTMTAAPEKDSQLLAIGIPCSHISCNLVDFLPFKCQHCQEPFCQEHFKVEAHQCQKYDENQYNRVAPNCNVVFSILRRSHLTVDPTKAPFAIHRLRFAKEKILTRVWTVI